MGKAANSVFFLPENVTASETGDAESDNFFLKMRFERGGEEYYLVDYAHAGRDWKSDIAAWLKTK